MWSPLGCRQGVIIFIELCIGQMTSGILYIDLRISFKKRCQLLWACRKEDKLCDKGSDNHANIRNSRRNRQCLSWQREEEKYESFCSFSKGYEWGRFNLCHRRRTRWRWHGEWFQLIARKDFPIVPYPDSEHEWQAGTCQPFWQSPGGDSCFWREVALDDLDNLFYPQILHKMSTHPGYIHCL